jgi:predicted nucleotidyltransferase
MDEKDRAIIMEFKSRLRPEIKDHVNKVIVFGSRARGSAAEDSDLDVIALVNGKTPEIERQLNEAAYQVMWDHDFKPIISLNVFDESRYHSALSKGFSFYRQVEKEGVAV